MIGTTAVCIKVTHLGEDYATVELTAQIYGTKDPARNLPKQEFDVPKAVGLWLEDMGAL